MECCDSNRSFEGHTAQVTLESEEKNDPPQKKNYKKCKMNRFFSFLILEQLWNSVPIELVTEVFDLVGEFANYCFVRKCTKASVIKADYNISSQYEATR